MIWGIILLPLSIFSRLVPWFDICSFQRLSIPSKTEPSDLSFAHDKLFMVSDNGRLLVFDSNDELSSVMKIDGKPDLEGIAADPQDPDIVYLGVEYPASILIYNLSSKKITKTINLQSEFDKYPTTIQGENNGLESLAYHLSDGKSTFLVGRQADALVFLFEYNKSDISVKLKTVFQPPGPSKDLSAITIWNERVWFLYDKGEELTAIKLTILPESEESKKKILEHDRSVGSFSFHFRGLEGISFVPRNETLWVYLAVDPPKKFGESQFLKYTLRSFFACFNDLGSIDSTQLYTM